MTREITSLFAPLIWSDLLVEDIFSFYDEVNTEDLVACEWVAKGRIWESIIDSRRTNEFHPSYERYSKEYDERMEMC